MSCSLQHKVYSTIQLFGWSLSHFCWAHTLGKLGWVVVDVGQSDVDGGGAREAADLACHVFGLDNDGVVFPGFPVHVR